MPHHSTEATHTASLIALAVVAGTLADPPAWMMTRSVLASMLADPAVGPRLRQQQVYEVLRPGQRPLEEMTTMPVMTFSAIAGLRGALDGGQLPPGARAVLYDPEAWPFTPLAEQRDPVLGAEQAAALARANGLQLIVAPALNLTTVLRPGGQGPRWQTFIDLGIAGSMATVADAVELQAQSLERDTGSYAAFVGAAAAQARAAGPEVSLLAGLSTNPPGAVVTSQQLTAAIQASRQLVDGYWLNIPGRGPRCPTCNPPRPDIGADVLRQTLGAAP